MSDDLYDDNLLPDDAPAGGGGGEAPMGAWSVLIVDDEEDVHLVTNLVLDGVEFKGRPIRLLSARTGDEALAVLRAEPDIALVLLDVVMESDDAGLRTVRAIREDLGNLHVRIVLRTGQPGRAPEREVVMRYEIDGYELKTSLTAQSLLTVVVAALRAYDLLRTLERGRRGLEGIVDAAAELSRARSVRRFATSVLPQVEALLGQGRDGVLYARTRAHAPPEQAEVLAGTGAYAAQVGRTLADLDAPAAWMRAIAEMAPAQSGATYDEGTTLRFGSPRGREAVLRFDGALPHSALERRLLDVFCAKVAVLLDSVHLLEQVSRTQRATVLALADLAEHRDTDTGAHVLRVACTADLLARDLHESGCFGGDLDDLMVEQIGLASMLHDVGKVAIPDAVLLKPGRLDTDERTLMETHAAVGGAILARADALVGDQSYMTIAACIAECHHEWFDGSGYPKGLAGEEIPVAARIVAVADVYDALVNARPYKPAWPSDEAVGYILGRAGTQFDPRVVEAFDRIRSHPSFGRAASLDAP